MDRDQSIGILLLCGSVAGIIVYGLLLWLFGIIVVLVTAFIAIAGVLGILGWIGWTMATAPPPRQIESPEIGRAGAIPNCTGF